MNTGIDFVRGIMTDYADPACDECILEIIDGITRPTSGPMRKGEVEYLLSKLDPVMALIKKAFIDGYKSSDLGGASCAYEKWKSEMEADYEH